MFTYIWLIIFPDYQDLLFIMGTLVQLNIQMLPDHEMLISLLFYSFIQVALMEEAMKALSIKALSFIRGKSEHGIFQTMFYTCVASLGFAAVENIHYFTQFQGNILPLRAFTAVLAHLSCGIIMGYFFALSRLQPSKSIIYLALGILLASCYHGLYDYFVLSMEAWRITLHFHRAVIQINPGYFGAFLGLIVSYPLYRRIKRLASIHDQAPRKNIPEGPTE